MENRFALNNFGHNAHPRDWPLEDLMIHLQYEMNYPIKKIISMSHEEMIEAVLKDEIERE